MPPLKNDVVRCLDCEDTPNLHFGGCYRVESVDHGHLKLSGVEGRYHAGRFVPVRPLGKALEGFPITVAGKEAHGTILATRRATGRRIVVHTFEEGLLFDSDDCYDLGNALNLLETWLTAQQGAEKPIPFERGGDPGFAADVMTNGPEAARQLLQRLGLDRE